VKKLPNIIGPKVIVPYRWLWVIAVIVGSIPSLPTVWSFADVANGLMAAPNLISLIMLNGVIVAETRRYLWSGNLNESASATPELVSAGSQNQFAITDLDGTNVVIVSKIRHVILQASRVIFPV
jgi:hypothetical protein